MSRSISIRDRKIQASIEVEEAQCIRVIGCTTEDAVRKAQEPHVRISTNFTQASPCVIAWGCPCQNRNGNARAVAAIIMFGGEQQKSEVLRPKDPLLTILNSSIFKLQAGESKKESTIEHSFGDFARHRLSYDSEYSALFGLWSGDNPHSTKDWEASRRKMKESDYGMAENGKVKKA